MCDFSVKMRNQRALVVGSYCLRNTMPESKISVGNISLGVILLIVQITPDEKIYSEKSAVHTDILQSQGKGLSDTGQSHLSLN